MPVKIEIPSPLREHTGGLVDVFVTGATVQAALDDLVRQYPAIGPKLFEAGKLRPYINLHVNDEDYRYLDEMDTATPDGTVLLVMPAISGG